MSYLSRIREIRETNQVLNEAIIAKDRTPYIRIEKLFKEIKDATGGDFKKFDATSRKNLRKIGDILEDTFNIGEVLFLNTGIVIMPLITKWEDLLLPAPTAACTISGNTSLIDFRAPFTKTAVIKTPHGIAFKDKRYRITINMAPGIIEQLTPGELTATVLHEIGHSFDETTGSSMKIIYSTMKDPISQVITRAYVDLWKLGISIIDKNIPKEKGSALLGLYKKYEALAYHGWKYYWTFYMKIPGFVKRFAHLIDRNIKFTGRSISWALDPLASSIIEPMFGFEGEIVSDNFAAACGYGPELASALRKFNHVENDLVDNSATMAVLLSTIGLFQDIFIEMDHPHMIPLDRMKSIKAYMIECRDQEIDPKVKAYLDDQIDEINEVIKLQAETDNKKYSRRLGAMLRFKKVGPDEAIEDLRILLPILQKDRGNLE